VTAGYTTAGLLAALYASAGEYRPGWGWTTLCLPALAAAVSLQGVWTGSDRLRRALDRATGRFPDLLLGRACRGRRVSAAFRAAGEGAAVLVCGGALLAVLALALRAGEAGAAFGRLAGGWVGGVTLLLLCVALLPNAAVWAAAYTLGPGFVLGQAVVAPLAGVAIGVCVARRAVAARPPWPWLRTAVLAALACLLSGVALAALAGLAGGPLGHGTLAAFGPVWWRTGLATVAWTLPAALPAALLARWILRRAQKRTGG
jgi:hypothetical protein